MRTEIHPAVRRITWLMIVVGAGTTLVSIVYLLFNLGPGVMLPFTKTALDTGWLAIFGLLWLGPGESRIAEDGKLPNKQIIENIDGLTRRLSSIEETLQLLSTRSEEW